MYATINETAGFHPARTDRYDYEVVREWNNTMEIATGSDGNALHFYSFGDAARYAAKLNGN